MYGLVIGIPEQRKQIAMHCFGDCGRIIVGAGYDPAIGEIGICRYDDCPYLDKQMSEPIGDIDGESLYLRKLKEC